jgi:hypothetical protein
MAIDPNEEAERVRLANENVEKWKAKFIGGDNGFSGGVRMTVETQDGVKESRVTRYGSLAASEKIMPPQETSKVITQPLPWWCRLLNHLLVEKTE